MQGSFRHEGEAERALLRALGDPSSLADLPTPVLDRVVRLARRSGLLPRLAVLQPAGEGRPGPDGKVADLLTAARATAEHHRRTLRWEVDRVVRAMSEIDLPVVLLKGAAYEMARLPPSRGRLASDVDILVPRNRLDRAEGVLARHGWFPQTSDPYDLRYYRRWMHELPPLQHEQRGTILDVHHTIAPRTAREVRPDAGAILADARPTPDPRVSTPCPEDLVVHSAIHAFHDGDFSEPLRDLVDLDDLAREFSNRDERFWERLTARARHHRASRPVGHGLRLARTVLRTPIPDRVLEEIERDCGGRARSRWLDAEIRRVLFPWIDGPPPTRIEIARLLLYVRSHVQRMPIHLLLPHLGRKVWRSWIRRVDDDPR